MTIREKMYLSIFVLGIILFIFSLLTFRVSLQMKENAFAWSEEIGAKIEVTQKKADDMKLLCAQYLYGHD